MDGDFCLQRQETVLQDRNEDQQEQIICGSFVLK